MDADGLLPTTRSGERASLGNRPPSPRQTSPIPRFPRSTLPDPGSLTRSYIFERALEILRLEFPKPLATPQPNTATSAPEFIPPSVPPAEPTTSAIRTSQSALALQIIPARMLNEFVYCPRLFYYEFVEGVFLESADTVRGKTLHRRVDSGKGDLPPTSEKKSVVRGQKAQKKTATLELPLEEAGVATPPSTLNSQPPTNDVIHSRSVQMGSERLGVTAKMDLVEVRTRTATFEDESIGDLFSGNEIIEVCPVDYKIGAPKEGEDGNELWDADRMQLGIQALILRDNGYTCCEGVIYYRETKQRVRLPITPELVLWVEERIIAARQIAAGTIPPPLVASPKCPRCSLAPICLPDETRFLAATSSQASTLNSQPAGVRRLIAARDDSRALYLSTPGLRVGRSEEVLHIKEEKKILDEVRLNDVSHVALFGNIQISTQAIQTLCELEVPVTYFSMGGGFYGVTRGHALKNVFLRIEQFRLAREPATCLRLARQFVLGKIRNHRTMLMRNHLEAPTATLLKLKQCADAALRAESIESLLGTEGAAAAAYFAQFDGMIKTADALDDQLPGAEVPTQPLFNFNFHGRNRRPPTDPVNALLSLAYSLLSKDCLLAALAVGFDPYVGFYHQPRFGRPALALDLMEEFRPLVAESAVLSCINNRVVSETDFVRAGQAVNLTPAGRKRFFHAYEQRMNSLLTHPIFDYKVSYRRALELQARMLAKTLTGEIPEYVPLTTR